MGQKLSSFWDQSFFIPTPTFTTTDLPDQTGKVHIVTGGYAGVGYHLTRALYSRNATVYVLGRSEAKASTAVSNLKAEFPAATGRLEFLFLDLADLTTIKPAVSTFLAKEERLDVLVHNAAVMVPPIGSKSVQGYELQTATNVYGPYLLTALLSDVLHATAQKSETGSVRIVWAASHAADLFGPPGGVHFVSDTVRGDGRMLKQDWKDAVTYAQSKAADIALAAECKERWAADGIISVSLNPGNLKTELVRDRTWLEKWIVEWMHYPAEMGAWTELFSGWSPEITPGMNGCYIIPWGRVGRFNEGLEGAIANGLGKEVWEVCEGVVRGFM